MACAVQKIMGLYQYQQNDYLKRKGQSIDPITLTMTK